LVSLTPIKFYAMRPILQVRLPVLQEARLAVLQLA
jgi:hypothetical protein